MLDNTILEQLDLRAIWLLFGVFTGWFSACIAGTVNDIYYYLKDKKNSKNSKNS